MAQPYGEAIKSVPHMLWFFVAWSHCICDWRTGHWHRYNSQQTRVGHTSVATGEADK